MLRLCEITWEFSCFISIPDLSLKSPLHSTTFIIEEYEGICEMEKVKMEKQEGNTPRRCSIKIQFRSFHLAPSFMVLAGNSHFFRLGLLKTPVGTF